MSVARWKTEPVLLVPAVAAAPAPAGWWSSGRLDLALSTRVLAASGSGALTAQLVRQQPAGPRSVRR